MKKFLFVLVLTIGVTTLIAQDKSAKEYKVEAADAYKAKDYQTGLNSFEKAIQLYEADGKTDTTLYYNAAICAIKVKDYDKSVSFFDRSIELGYKDCKSKLYKANALKGKGDMTQMETVATDGAQSCPKYKSKFTDLLFQHYMKSGLAIFNGAAKKQADITPLAQSDPDGYKAGMENVKAEFKNSLPMLEKAHDLKPEDENCKKALKQAYELLDMQTEASAL